MKVEKLAALPVDMTDRRVIVTAGAGGIGAAIAAAFAERGARVHVCDVDEAALQACPHACARADMSRREEVEAYMARALDWLGGLDVLVNNAGIAGPTAGIAEVDPQALAATLDINLQAQFHTVRLALPALRESGGGSIINISSVAGRMGVPQRTPYAASKWGVVGLTRSLAVELGHEGIRVNALLPGLVAGARIGRVIEARARNMGVSVEEETRLELAGVSLGRFVQPGDIANMALFLASPFGAMISGQAISIDGDLQALPWQPGH
ncbi:short chain dehydrogenase [Bordetella trematum]|uniref:SDR family oxidoreductase n=1 Tax=Bordetella trematum TaxID=123899 RepID=UPI00068B55C9|nr:SDR family oxidoreductase [Bordetella trematum]AUL45972.1 3-oxoacyl-[acyl-carrier-protein] reductase [Bordetella trematum]SAI45475.1 short chain dehydrogenase [Bordetella trematum]